MPDCFGDFNYVRMNTTKIIFSASSFNFTQRNGIDGVVTIPKRRDKYVLLF